MQTHFTCDHVHEYSGWAWPVCQPASRQTPTCRAVGPWLKACGWLQVLTVHSPFRIENCTNKPLEFVVHLFVAPNMQDALPAMHGSAATSNVPSKGPLLPGLQCYLPAPAIWCDLPAPF